MRTRSHRHDRVRINLRFSTSMPYTSWRSASMRDQRVRRSRHETVCPEICASASAGTSYHSQRPVSGS